VTSFVWWAVTLNEYRERLQLEAKALSGKMQSNLIDAKSYQEKFFILRGPTNEVFGKFRTLFIAGLEHEFLVEFKCSLRLHDSAQNLEGTLLAGADKQHQLDRLLLQFETTLRAKPSEARSLHYLQLIFSDDLLILRTHLAQKKTEINYPIKYRPKFFNPVFPFNRIYERTGKNKLFVPTRTLFMNPINRNSWLFNIRETNEKKIIDGVQTSGYELKYKELKLHFFLSREGEIMALHLPHGFIIEQINEYASIPLTDLSFNALQNKLITIFNSFSNLKPNQPVSGQ